MKTFLKTFVPGALLFLALAGPAVAQSKTAIIDYRRVFDGYWKTKQADAVLRDRAMDADKTHKEMIEKYRKAKEEYQALLATVTDPIISSEERDKRKKDSEEKFKGLKAAEDDITLFERQVGASLAEQKATVRKNILGEIKLAVSSKAKAGGFALVIDSESQTYVPDPTGPYYTPTVLYTSGENDLTESVAAELARTAPVETIKPSEKAVKPETSMPRFDKPVTPAPTTKPVTPAPTTKP